MDERSITLDRDGYRTVTVHCLTSYSSDWDFSFRRVESEMLVCMSRAVACLLFIVLLGIACSSGSATRQSAPLAGTARTDMVVPTALSPAAVGRSLTGSPTVVEVTTPSRRSSTAELTPSSSSTEAACSDTDGYDRVRPSLVRIEAGDSIGSGVIVRSEGYILTNSHVVQGHQSVLVLLADGRKLAGIVAADLPEEDLALISIKASGLAAITWGDDMALHPGRRLLALGYALDLPGEPTLTSGTYSAHRQDGNHSYVQTDAALNPGNSGGPLFTTCGDVVGIVEFGYRNAQGLNFAISSTDAQVVLGVLLTQAALPASASPEGTAAHGTAQPTQASPVPTVAGSWYILDTVQYGDALGLQFPFHIALVQDGEHIAGEGDGLTIQGTIDGSKVSASYQEDNGSGGTFRWSLSADGSTLQGNFDNSSGNGGTSTGQRMASPSITVLLFYTYLAERHYAEAYALLSADFQVQHPYASWVVGYSTTQSIEVQVVRDQVTSPPTVYVSLQAADLINGEVVTRGFAGTWVLVSQGGTWKLDRATVRQT